MGWTTGAVLAFGIALVNGVTVRLAAATWVAAAFGDAERWYRALTGESD